MIFTPAYEDTRPAQLLGLNREIISSHLILACFSRHDSPRLEQMASARRDDVKGCYQWLSVLLSQGMSCYVEQGCDWVRLAEAVHYFGLIAHSQLFITGSFRKEGGNPGDGVNQSTTKGVPQLLPVLAGHVWVMTSSDVMRNTLEVHVIPPPPCALTH